jgi:hypothetical protein
MGKYIHAYSSAWKCVTSLMSWQLYFCTNCTAEGANPTDIINVLPETELFALTGIEPLSPSGYPACLHTQMKQHVSHNNSSAKPSHSYS